MALPDGLAALLQDIGFMVLSSAPAADEIKTTPKERALQAEISFHGLANKFELGMYYALTNNNLRHHRQWLEVIGSPPTKPLLTRDTWSRWLASLSSAGIFSLANRFVPWAPRSRLVNELSDYFYHNTPHNLAGWMPSSPLVQFLNKHNIPYYDGSVVMLSKEQQDTILHYLPYCSWTGRQRARYGSLVQRGIGLPLCEHPTEALTSAIINLRPMPAIEQKYVLLPRRLEHIGPADVADIRAGKAFCWDNPLSSPGFIADLARSKLRDDLSNEDIATIMQSFFKLPGHTMQGSISYLLRGYQATSPPAGLDGHMRAVTEARNKARSRLKRPLFHVGDLAIDPDPVQSLLMLLYQYPDRVLPLSWEPALMAMVVEQPMSKVAEFLGEVAPADATTTAAKEEYYLLHLPTTVRRYVSAVSRTSFVPREQVFDLDNDNDNHTTKELLALAGVRCLYWHDPIDLYQRLSYMTVMPGFFIPSEFKSRNTKTWLSGDPIVGPTEKGEGCVAFGTLNDYIAYHPDDIEFALQPGPDGKVRPFRPDDLKRRFAQPELIAYGQLAVVLGWTHRAGRAGSAVAAMEAQRNANVLDGASADDREIIAALLQSMTTLGWYMRGWPGGEAPKPYRAEQTVHVSKDATIMLRISEMYKHVIQPMISSTTRLILQDMEVTAPPPGGPYNLLDLMEATASGSEELCIRVGSTPMLLTCDDYETKLFDRSPLGPNRSRLERIS